MEISVKVSYFILLLPEHEVLPQVKDNWMSSHVPTYSAIDSYSLPDNVAIITLQVIFTYPCYMNIISLFINFFGKEREAIRNTSCDL